MNEEDKKKRIATYYKIANDSELDMFMCQCETDDDRFAQAIGFYAGWAFFWREKAYDMENS